LDDTTQSTEDILANLGEAVARDNQIEPSWVYPPTRAVIITLNYVNEELGLLMQIKLVSY